MIKKEFQTLVLQELKSPKSDLLEIKAESSKTNEKLEVISKKF